MIIHSNVSADTDDQVLPIAEIEWTMLNPARGDKSPMAATLWGDRGGSVPTGFLVKFVDGFSSPPHIHNVAYRGLVINGLIHNADPAADKLWMPSGSFWTQPAGDVHITAANGKYNLAYIEIDKGPYLVRPIEDSFDDGEEPVNLIESNIEWIKQDSGSTENIIELAHLWGSPHNGKDYGVLIRMPAGKNSRISTDGTVFHAVLIKGQIDYQPNESVSRMLMPGSYFSNNKTMTYKINSNEESLIYVRTNGDLTFPSS